MPELTTTDLTVTVIVAQPVEAAFATFTERIHEWWPLSHRLQAGERSDLTIDPQVGGHWFETDELGTICNWGEVLAWSPPHHLRLGWQITPAFAPEPDPRRASRVDVSFTPVDADNTKVTLVHADLDRHGDGWELMRRGVDGDSGWPGILASYADLAASPQAAPPD